MKFLFIVLLVCSLAGCASQGKYFQTANPLTGEPLFQCTLPTDKACANFMRYVKSNSKREDEMLIDASSCRQTSLAQVLPYHAIVKVTPIEMSFVIDTVSMPLCEQFVSGMIAKGKDQIDVTDPCHKK